MSDNLFYRLNGQLDRMVLVGPVAEGIRMDGHFSGRLTAGPMTGATVTLVDYFRLRADGVGVVDAHEIVEFGGAQISVRVAGYVLPPAGMPVPPPEVVASPDFAWPDVPFAIEAFATFQTADPRLADLNRTIVSHVGSVNLSTGELVVEARRLPSPAVDTSIASLVQAANGGL